MNGNYEALERRVAALERAAAESVARLSKVDVTIELPKSEAAGKAGTLYFNAQTVNAVYYNYSGTWLTGSVLFMSAMSPEGALEDRVPVTKDLLSMYLDYATPAFAKAFGEHGLKVRKVQLPSVEGPGQGVTRTYNGARCSYWIQPDADRHCYMYAINGPRDGCRVRVHPSAICGVSPVVVVC